MIKKKKRSYKKMKKKIKKERPENFEFEEAEIKALNKEIVGKENWKW